MDPAKHKLYESAFVKSIRRCRPDDAIYWGSLLYRLGKDDVVWRRIFIHLSEDIGIADRALPASIAALHDNYKRLMEPGTTCYEGKDIRRLPLVHAIMLMATAPKSRAVDNATVVHFSGECDKKCETRPIPDYAYDFHSPLGRRMGLDAKHFLTVAGKIENEVPEIDLWKDRAFELLTGEKPQK